MAPLSRGSRLRVAVVVALAVTATVTAACGRSDLAGSGSPLATPTTVAPSVTSAPTSGADASSSAPASPSGPAPGEFTFSFAGDVNFEDRTAARLAADPATVFGVAQKGLAAADLTMVNLETAVTTGGAAQDKEFTFRAPPAALVALRDAGVDIATMANNHGADYGPVGLRDTLAAIESSGFPVVGIGADAAQAYAPWVTTVRGTRIAVIAASQVRDETLANFSAGTHSAGIANAYSPLLLAAVKAAKAAGDVVIVYVHWGTEYVNCPNNDQETLARELAAAGASAVIGTHVHVLQGAGWRSDGVFVAYGLGNYLWWKSFGNTQDDNGVLTLTFRGSKVVADHFAASHLDATGVPVPATGATLARIDAEWASVRKCTDLSATPPS
jgi:poly-gamma-glutamate synthesis protein (capsule biosynthesis protein)